MSSNARMNIYSMYEQQIVMGCSLLEPHNDYYVLPQQCCMYWEQWEDLQ